MSIRSSTLLRLLLIVVAVAASLYTAKMYMELIGRWTGPSTEGETTPPEKAGGVEENEVEPGPPKLPEVAVPKYACEMKKQCDGAKEIPFQIVSGAANIIGPTICVNGKWLMSNSIGNVNRGMNVAVVSGKTGEMTKSKVFDLYGQSSDSFVAFLKELADEDVTFIATFDDATQKLDRPARIALADLGSEKAEKLAFRDNWLFVGGKKLKHHMDLERHIPSNRDTNKFGLWPGTVTLEGCLTKL